MEKRTPEGASDALVPIVSALSISSCSEKLLQMKAEALFMVSRLSFSAPKKLNFTLTEH